MTKVKKSRRDFLISSGSVMSASWLAVNTPLILAASKTAQEDLKAQAAYTNISQAEAVEFSALVEQIIPADDTPGAAEIGVVYFIDIALGSFMAGAAETLRQGLADLQQKVNLPPGQNKLFSELSFAQQTATLKQVEDTAFFGTLHFFTMMGMFALPTYGGNRDHLGWELLGFDHQHAWQAHLVSMMRSCMGKPMNRGMIVKAADNMPKFKTREAVDFVIIGSGAAGGVLAKELSTNGFDVVVLEQGEYRTAADFKHDEVSVMFQNELMNHPGWNDPQSFRQFEHETATVPGGGPPPALYARGVGGSSVHFTANYWRFHESDFKERSLLGPMQGTGFADWPISYQELEPYYTKVEWECGVSGQPGPFEAPRSRPYPCPPLPVKSSGVLFEKGARAMGLHPQPAPMAILSKPHNGRPACIHCGFCMGFGCEANAKSSTLASMIPLAEATGRCEIRPLSTVFRIETNAQGRVTEVVYLDAKGQQQAQKAKAVILAANGAETPRLLFLSESSRSPDGLANSSGIVGKYLMGNGHSNTQAAFEQPLNEFKSVQVTRIVHDFYEHDPRRGFYGGGGMDARPFLDATPIMYALSGLPPGAPKWGLEFKQMLRHYYTRKMSVLGSTTSVPLERNNITLDSTIKDDKGRAAARMTYMDHDDDLSMALFLQDRAVEILGAAGAKEIWREPVEGSRVLAHLLGTCRMGNDPTTSVVDKYHRSHDISNLFICDGSSFVSSGRGQPTMTIQALAFRAAEHIAQFARQGDI